MGQQAGGAPVGRRVVCHTCLLEQGQELQCLEAYVRHRVAHDVHGKVENVLTNEPAAEPVGSKGSRPGASSHDWRRGTCPCLSRLLRNAWTRSMKTRRW